MNANTISFVNATAEDEPILWVMLTHAASMTEPLDEAIARAKADPYLGTYVAGFGQRDGDMGIVAEDEQGVGVGAAWLRLSHEPDPFRVSGNNTPELAMGLSPEFRGQGIGTKMLAALFEMARPKYEAVALSVREANPALHLYRRFGFVETGRITNRVGGVSFTMLLKLR